MVNQSCRCKWCSYLLMQSMEVTHEGHDATLDTISSGPLVMEIYGLH
jgi:hypothetical protein